MRLLLDTSVLGWVCHPRQHGEVRDWFQQALPVHDILVSEVADYELRRELLRIRAPRSIAHLDELGRELVYLPVTTATWRTAARFWATQRQTGRVTAPPDALDADVLIAAQALSEDAVVVTSNPRHFEGLARALEWRDVPAG